MSRSYAGQGAKELFDILERRSSEIERLMRTVPGFEAYTLFRTAEGGVSITVCRDQTGAQDSLRIAREWVAANAGTTGVAAPTVAEGTVILQMGGAGSTSAAA